MNSAQERHITWRPDADALRIFDGDELIVIVTSQPAVTRTIVSELANRTIRPNDVFQFRTLRQQTRRYRGITSLVMNGTVIALGKITERSGPTEWWRVDWRATAPASKDSSVHVYVGGWYMGTVSSCAGNDGDANSLLNRVATRLQRATGTQGQKPKRVAAHARIESQRNPTRYN